MSLGFLTAQLPLKATFHSTIDIPMRPVRQDQRHLRRSTR